MARIIALDLGQKRIGVAISDETETISSPLTTIPGDNTNRAIKGIKEIIDSRDVLKVIIGLPLNMNGSEGPKAMEALEFADKLRKKLLIDVVTFDERLTTKQGEDMLIQADVSRKKRKSVIDKIAAQIILQTYLDSEKIRKQE